MKFWYLVQPFAKFWKYEFWRKGIFQSSFLQTKTFCVGIWQKDKGMDRQKGRANNALQIDTFSFFFDQKDMLE